MNIYIQNKEIFDYITNNPSFNLEGLNFVYSETINDRDILKQLNKNKYKEAIYINNYGNFTKVFRKNGTWKYFDKTAFDLLFLKKAEQISIASNNESNRKEILEKFASNLNISGRWDFFDKKNPDFYLEQLIFLLDENWKINLDEFEMKYSYPKVSISRIKKKDDYFDAFINNVKNKAQMPGLSVNKVFDSSENEIIFSSKETLVNISSNEHTIFIILISNSDDEVSSFYLNKGMIENLKNNLLRNKTSKQKIRTRDIVISVVGLIFFIILTALTIVYIIEPKNIEESFKIIFSPETLKQPWIYLLWINFFSTFFFSFWIMFIVSFMLTGKLPNWKMILSFFIAAQIKGTVRFITGEEILGTILWAWYLNKNTTIRTSSLFGGMATMSLIRIPITFVLKSPFMIIGQIYAVQLFNTFSQIDGNASMIINESLFYTLSWGGFVWELLHNSLIPIIILLPFAHKMFNITYSKYLILRNESDVITKLETREMSILSMKKSVRKIFTRKDRIIRASLSIVILAIMEALEIMYIYKIVENYMWSQGAFGTLVDFPRAEYNNFLQLSGIRMMISNVRLFPLINIMPGEGMGVIEYFMTNLNDVIFINAHGGVGVLGGNSIDEIMNVSSDFSKQSAFITRFFNSYLRRIMSLTVVLIIVSKIFIRKVKS